MKKTVRRIFVLLVALAMLAAGAVQVFAGEKVETEKDVALTISFTDGDKVIKNAPFSIWKVADVSESDQYSLTEAFKPFERSVKGLYSLNEITNAQVWTDMACTLSGIVQDQEIAQNAGGKTDANGALPLTVKPGLYLVTGKRTAGPDDYEYVPYAFMLHLPAVDVDTNGWSYDVTVSPKYEKEYVPPEDPDEPDEPRRVTRKVLKVWDDKGCEEDRPDEVTVKLLRDGKTYDTQKLSDANDWKYTWNDLSDRYDWTIVEKLVDGYTVSVSHSGITFVVTNTKTPPYVPPVEPPDEPPVEPPEEPPVTPPAPGEPKLPQTGVLWWPVPVLLYLGIISLVIGLVRRRRNN